MSDDRMQSDEANRYALFIGALVSPVRLEILKLIMASELSVWQLIKQLGSVNQSALWQHLAKLREAKLVTTCREAQTIYYSCKRPGMA